MGAEPADTASVVLRTETGSAAVLLAAAAAALVWVNVDPRTYDGVWSTRLSIHLGGSDVSLDLRGWLYSAGGGGHGDVDSAGSRGGGGGGEHQRRPALNGDPATAHA